MTKFLGENDSHLRLIESQFESEIAVRGNEISIAGPSSDSQTVSALFAEMIGLVEAGERLSADKVERSIELMKHGECTPTTLHGDVILTYKGKAIRPKTAT